MTSLRIILATAGVVAVTGCVTEEAPTSSKVTLDGETRTATALSFDVLSPADVRIVLAHEVDREVCGWTAFDSVEMNLLIGDRTTPHVIAFFDVTTPNRGRVSSIRISATAAISGGVTPALTIWAFKETEATVIADDGTFDVGSPMVALGGAFGHTLQHLSRQRAVRRRDFAERSLRTLANATARRHRRDTAAAPSSGSGRAIARRETPDVARCSAVISNYPAIARRRSSAAAVDRTARARRHP
jgi:hypothetical protein